MAINLISPTTFTTGVIIGDTQTSATGSSDVIPSTITPGACLDVQSTKGGVLFPRMTSAQVAALPARPNGLMLYNTDTASFEFYEGGTPSFLTNVPINGNSTNNNIFMGYNVGNDAALTTSTNNIIFSALSSATNLTTGLRNTGVGVSCFDHLGSGSDNVALGFSALFNMTSQSGNVGVGSNAFFNSSNPSNSVAVGLSAGSTQNSYTECTFIGHRADASTNGLTNATAIGSQATVSASNSLVLGSISSTLVGIGVSAPLAKLHVVTTGIGISCQGSFIPRVQVDSGTSYSIGANDFFVHTTGPSTGATTITLPAIVTSGVNNNAHVIYTIKDGSGNAGTNNITINTTGGVNIDGASTKLINKNYGWMSVYNDGANWFIWNKDFF